MAQWVMKGNGNVVPRQTLRLLKRRWGTSIYPPLETTPNDWDPYDEYEDDDEIARSLPETEETDNANGTLIDQQPAYDKIINAE
eukprot:1878872-Ditylum_brightwellii.AAC.1